jgi:hypothetical protein
MSNLTDEQIAEIALKTVYQGDATTPYRADWTAEIGIPFARAIERATAARAESAEAERDKREHQLGNILARIYRDGGQHMVQHGTDEAVRAADDVLAGWITAVDERDRYRDALIACRPAVSVHLYNFRMARAEKGVDQAQALLDTIDAAAAAKGQG